MRGSSKVAIFSLAERCKNILAANCQAVMNTIKADAKGSKDEIYTSKVKFLLRKGKPYIWIPEEDLHNMNTIIDDRGSLSVCSPVPGPLLGLLRSLNKIPARVALAGEVLHLADEKVPSAMQILKDTILSEQNAVSKASHSVSSILNSAGSSCRSISKNLQELLNESVKYEIYKFDVKSCSYIDANGEIHEVQPNEFQDSEVDILAPLSGKLIDGINQNEARRRALMLLCLLHFNVNTRDALVLGIDSKGFDVLAKIHGATKESGFNPKQWKELRFTFKEQVPSIEVFCNLLVEMEEEALKFSQFLSLILTHSAMIQDGSSNVLIDSRVNLFTNRRHHPEYNYDMFKKLSPGIEGVMCH